MDEISNFESLEPNVVPLRPTLASLSLSNSERQVKQRFSGPLSGPMWMRAHQIKSNYPDNFDYGIYDRLHERFSDKQPRGGVVYKGTLKLLEAQECQKCFYRFEIDTYGRGCTHNCAYCYAKSYLSVRKYWNEPMPFPIDIAEIRRIFAIVFETDKKHKLRSVLEKRIPLRIGSMSDSFMWLDKKYKVTQELLKILKFYKYPYIIFTRSDLVAEDEYIRLLDRNLASVQMSISSINEELTRTIEPGAPSPTRRLAALKKLSEEGFWTTVRINPLFPIYPDGYYTNPNFDRSKDIKPFNYFSWDMVDAIAEHKVPTVLAGVVRLYEPSIRFMNRALGWDFRDTFETSSAFKRDYIEFSLSEANYYYKRLQDLSAKKGLRFTTCYIGGDTAGASFDYNKSLWSNKADCCDARGNVPAFQTSCADLPSSSQLATPGLTTLEAKVSNDVVQPSCS